ncbi:MAG TPA: hypothetical protein VMI32_14775 [Candidatus Solibacter sp.]|nr:hypothetical protein [Candidatus Solibacter sp.]
MNRLAKTYVALVIAAGASVMFLATDRWSSASLVSFSAFLALTVIASTLKFRIPGMTGTMSANFAFLLIGVASFSFSEVVLVSFAAALVQCLWRPKQRLRMIQVLFSAATLPISAAVSFWASHAIVRNLFSNSSLAIVILAGCFYMSINTILVSLVVGLVEGQKFQRVWQTCYDSVFPFFLVGTLVTGMLAGSLAGAKPWQKALFLLPVIVLSHLYFLGRHKRTVHADYLSEEPGDEAELLAVSSAHR